MFLVVSVKVIAYIVNRAFCIKMPTNRADGTLDPKLPRDEVLRGKWKEFLMHTCRSIHKSDYSYCRIYLFNNTFYRYSVALRIVKKLFIIKLCSYCIKIIFFIRTCSKRAIKMLDYLIILINKNNI